MPPEFPALAADEIAFAMGFFESNAMRLHKILDSAASHPGSKTALLATVIGLRDDVAGWPADLARLLAQRHEALR